jgi:hypothetical protein
VFIAAIVLCSLVFSAAAQSESPSTFDSPKFRPVSPEVLAQGDSFSAIAAGYDSLFTNPAGLGRDGGTVTIIGVNPLSYYFPQTESGEGLLGAVQNDLDAFNDLAGGNLGAISDVGDIILENGIGIGARIVPLAIAGRNFGLAAVGEVDIYGRGGVTALGTTLDATITAGLVAGLAFPINLGFADLRVGGAMKVLRRAEVPNIGFIDLLSATSGGSSGELPVSVYSGFGLGFDAGAQLERGPWSAGVAFHDIFGTGFNYSEGVGFNPDNPLTALTGEGGLPVTERFAIPMSMSLGIGWDPNPRGLLRAVFDPKLHLEYRPTFFAESSNSRSFLASLHAGAEVRVFRFIKLRAGVNQGYITAGLGVRLLLLDINLAYFNREMGRFAGSRPNEGLSLEVALLRFNM